MSPHIDSVDEARLLPRFRETARLETQQARVFKGEHHRAVTAGIDASTPRARTNDGLMVDPLELRGIPVVGRGVGGVSPHTQPEREAIDRITRAEGRAA